MAQCSICSSDIILPNGETVRETVDALLDAEAFLSDIAAQVNVELSRVAPGLSIHRSSVHRHARKCYSLRIRAALLKERETARRAPRVVIEWPPNCGEFGGKLTTDTESETDTAPRIIAPNELREMDILIIVSFEQLTPRKTAALQKQEAPKEENQPPSTV